VKEEGSTLTRQQESMTHVVQEMQTWLGHHMEEMRRSILQEITKDQPTGNQAISL